MMKTLREVQYTATTGRQFMLKQVQDEHGTFWSYTVDCDGVEYWPTISRLANRHRTQEAAINRIESEEKIRLASDSIPRGGFDRATYETICAEYGAEVYSDDRIRRSAYALRYGEFTLPEYSVEAIVSKVLARGRLYALEAQPAPVATRSSVRTQPQRTCLVCGAYADMNASFGPACAEHYDELS